MSKALADLIFPEIDKIPADYEKLYPPRLLADGKEQTCVRFAPSPTGFIHLGGLYTALINMMVARQHQGAFVLRIEDTDQKRSVAGGIAEIVDSLAHFKIDFTEGAISEQESQGEYAPYLQSERREIYRCFAKALVASDEAYPCFCSSAELAAIRQRQQEEKSEVIGYAEADAHCRFLTEAEAIRRIEQGEAYIVRLRAHGKHGEVRIYHDGLRGDLELPTNNQDVVIIKGDGLPTYHFAHAVDDHLMRTTAVIRADEWISSLPIHYDLFERLGFEPPQYYHLSPLLKSDNGSRRKLSKRLDPEARVSYFREQGYPVEAVIEYLLTIANSNFEEWREENPGAALADFAFALEKSGVSGALFDFAKLQHIAKAKIAALTDTEIVAALQDWFEADVETAENATGRKLLHYWLTDERECLLSSVKIWHEDRLDVATWSQVMADYLYLYDPQFAKRRIELPEALAAYRVDIPQILTAYLDSYVATDDSSAWFDKIRGLCPQFGYAVKPKLFKRNPTEYRGSIAELASFVRFAVTGQMNSPDLYQIVSWLGEAEMRRRVENLIAFCAGD